MVHVDVPIRSPVTTPWLVTIASVVACGELVLEAKNPEIARFFDIPFTDGEVYVGAGIALVVAILGMIWLASLYFYPGRLVVDERADRVSRCRRPFIRQHENSAPLASWRVGITYFSDHDADAGIFKRIDLAGPNYGEVLLFADLPKGESLAQALHALESKFGAFERKVQRAANPVPPPTTSSD